MYSVVFDNDWDSFSAGGFYFQCDHFSEDYPTKIFQDQTYCWLKNDRYHRKTGPAIIYANGNQHWFLYGMRHRVGGPAFLDLSKKYPITAWYRYNKLHRVGGPARKFNNVTEWWYKGQLHRTDGPAVESLTKCGVDQEWWFKGLRHRDNGPAVIFATGHTEWWKHGAEYIMNSNGVLIMAQ